MACQAFAMEVEAPTTEREYREGVAPDKGKGVPVYVMMPLDIVTMNNTESEEGDERKLAGTEERKGGGDNDGRVMGVDGERHAGHLQRIGGFIGSDRTCSEPPLLTTMTKTTTTDLTQTTIVEGLLCNIWVYFLVFFDGFAPVWVWFFGF
jgi:hypothetical protein